jgi:hypothetical protein
MILDELLAARKRAKRDMAAALLRAAWVASHRRWMMRSDEGC